ncbi:hypothetical protein [Pseudomonas sp. EA_35y_Pfl2_R5]|uniref:hypothetical protein n=1 Tax=Pseudomonas sp. EA_35y_Pfl2_R5 TaxID=3088690 RepID=UPI0030D756DB
MNRQPNTIADIDLFFIIFILLLGLATPFIMVFIYSDSNNWASGVQAASSAVAIIASALTVILANRLSINNGIQKQAEADQRVYRMLHSLLLQINEHFDFIRLNAVSGLKSKTSLPENWRPKVGHTAEGWDRYASKASDIRTQITLLKRQLQSISQFNNVIIGDGVIFRKIANLTAHIETMLEEMRAGWELSDGDPKEEITTEYIDPVKYPPSKGLNETQINIGISHYIARGFFSHYIEHETPKEASRIFKEVLTDLKTLITD